MCMRIAESQEIRQVKFPLTFFLKINFLHIYWCTHHAFTVYHYQLQPLEKKLYKLHFLIFIFSVLSTIVTIKPSWNNKISILFFQQESPLHLSQNLILPSGGISLRFDDWVKCPLALWGYADSYVVHLPSLLVQVLS